MDFAPTTSRPRGAQGQIRASYEGCSTIAVAFFLSLHAAPPSRPDHHGCGAETQTRDHPPPPGTTRVIFIGVKQVSAPSRSSSAASPASSSPGPQRGASGCQSGKRTSLQHVLPQRPPLARCVCFIRASLATSATAHALQHARPVSGHQGNPVSGLPTLLGFGTSKTNREVALLGRATDLKIGRAHV